MKYKVLYILILVFFINLTLYAQRGQRIAYIDTEYILQNVPEYQEANAQLDKKVLEWKSEIDKKLNVIATKKQELEAERILLTKELYEERLEDIHIEENEVLDYQQKRFGPEGDYISQKNQLVQPIQDQIFATVQEIAESRKYDFIFDKSADLTMLFSAKQYDVSEFVLRSITRSATRKQAQTKQERQAAEEEELVPEINTAKEERELALADKKAAREKEIEDRRQQQLEEREAAKAAAEARRQQIMEERTKAREAKLGNKSDGAKEASDGSQTPNKKEESTQKSAKELMEEQRAEKLKEREALRQKAVEIRQGNNPPTLKEEPAIKGDQKTDTATTKSEKTVKTKKSTEAKESKDADSRAVNKAKTPQQLMEEERQRKLKEREEKRQAVLNSKNQESGSKTEGKTEKVSDSTKAEKPMTAQEKMEAERQKKIEEREQRRKELEERKQKILEERKKQREQQEAEKKTDTTNNTN